MSRAAARRGPHSIAAQLEYQLLWHRVAVADRDGEVLAALAPLLASAPQEIEPSRSQSYEATAVAAGWALAYGLPPAARSETRRTGARRERKLPMTLR